MHDHTEIEILDACKEEPKVAPETCPPLERSLNAVFVSFPSQDIYLDLSRLKSSQLLPSHSPLHPLCTLVFSALLDRDFCFEC